MIRYWGTVEMFKVRMQGQYGSKDDKRLRDVAKEMWRDRGFRKGVMRGYWVCDPFAFPVMCAENPAQITVAREIPAYAG